MTACTLYVIRCGEFGPFKIGRARDVNKRLSNLQSAHHEQLHLVAHFEGDDCDEGGLHDLFEGTRIRGEWFGASDLLNDFIAACGARTGKEWAYEKMREIGEREMERITAIRNETAKQMLARLKAERELDDA